MKEKRKIKEEIINNLEEERNNAKNEIE